MRSIYSLPKVYQKHLYDTLFDEIDKKEKLWATFVLKFDSEVFDDLHRDIQEDMFKTLHQRFYRILDYWHVKRIIQDSIDECNETTSSHFLNRTYLLCLLTLAKRHLKTNNRLKYTKPCNVLYRNKPQSYFYKIETKRNNWMRE